MSPPPFVSLVLSVCRVVEGPGLRPVETPPVQALGQGGAVGPVETPATAGLTPPKGRGGWTAARSAACGDPGLRPASNPLGQAPSPNKG